mmetsp:Transcript_4376/g.7340  ORF Transcript_4376/g.7340 Transcript_4376/m.7340 type:complete len:362 (-) Transcript_4376:1292-2377(-)
MGTRREDRFNKFIERKSGHSWGKIEATSSYQKQINSEVQQDTTAKMQAPLLRRKGQRLPDDANDMTAEGLLEPRRRKASSRKSKSSSKSKGRLLKTPGALQYRRVPSIRAPHLQRTSAEASPSTREDYSVLPGRGALLGEEARKEKLKLVALKEQLVALKVHNRELEEELRIEKAKKHKDRYRSELEHLEEENLDMQHDLAETRKIKDRLEKENRLLGKKLIKRNAENNRLRAQLGSSTGENGDERNVGRDSDTVNYERPEERSPRQLERTSRSSLWKLLEEETISESPVYSHSDSKGSIFESLFGGSGTNAFTNSLADMSVMTGSSVHSHTDGRPPYSPRNDGSRRTALRFPQGGFVPAA